MRHEYCMVCSDATVHEVWVELVEEAPGAENADLSREPYRYRECDVCGVRTMQRLNEGKTGTSGDIKVV